MKTKKIERNLIKYLLLYSGMQTTFRVVCGIVAVGISTEEIHLFSRQTDK